MSGTSPKVAIITGASSGIGRASSIAFSTAGWNVVLCARREELKPAAAECLTPTLIIVGDVTSEEDVKRLFEETVKSFGLDFLFNLVLGTVLCTKEAVRQYKKQSPQGARIINNGSISAHTPRPHGISYTSYKHAVTGITKSTTLDGRVFDISVTQIEIGMSMNHLALLIFTTRIIRSTLTTMAKPISVGAMQADGVVCPEAIMGVEYAVDTVIHIVGLPNTVQIVEMDIVRMASSSSIHPWYLFKMSRPTKMPFVGRG
ncbi:hypothetical protein M422DRAFT_265697 [Sphaerobolus stellatus SS14]|uniref:NAD(P)-binding protein n=1 Tax=Sphaerobolus stellatus (strain SS14) TaxID=990650 RepID=A0A0C9V4W5_SPHS4|nr:hypothetical protein M422DRAFT_265697 [Sphaerobolus stellatus SS14]